MTLSDPRTKTVFVVDDDASHVEILERALRREGFQVMTACTTEQFQENLKASTPDLFVLDLMMPGMSGIEIIRHLQAEGKGYIPVLVVSGRYADNKGDERMIRQEPNVVDFMKKPIRITMFVLRVHQILQTDPTALKKPLPGS